MTTNDLEGGVVSGNVGSQPIASTNQTPAVSTSSEPTLAEVLQQLKELQGHVRSLQSGKDKGTQRVQTEVQSLAEQMKRYGEYLDRYKDPGEAARQYELDDLLAQKRQGISNTNATYTGKDGSPTATSGVDYTGFINAMGLPVNDAEVVAATTSGGETLDVINKLTDIANKRRQSPKPPAQPSPLPSSGGQTLPGEETLDDVTAKLDQAMSQPVLDMTLVRILKAKQLALMSKPR